MNASCQHVGILGVVEVWPLMQEHMYMYNIIPLVTLVKCCRLVPSLAYIFDIVISTKMPTC